MINEEKILSNSLGKDNHFKVPEAYFDHLMEQVMDQLPEQKAQTIDIQSMPSTAWWRQLNVRKIAASVAAVAVLGGGILLALEEQTAQHGGSLVHAEQSLMKQNNSEDATFDEMANYTMMDNETIYASLIAEN